MPKLAHGPQRRLARQVREAALLASPDELHRIETIVCQVEHGDLVAFQACQQITALIRGQLARINASQQHERTEAA